jgi:probable HAF family extracellular repeat protein
MPRLATLVSLAACSLALAAEGVAASKGHYRLTDIGDLTTSHQASVTFASGINDAGDIVGQSFNDELKGRAFIWQKGRMTDLGDVGLLAGFPASLSAFAVNKHGAVVGTAMGTGSNTTTRAFLWNRGLMLDIGTLRGQGLGVFASAINDKGAIVGAGFRSPDDLRALRWVLGIPLELGGLDDGRVAVQALGVNDKGDIVGYLSPGGNVSFARAFIYKSGRFTDLGVLPGTTLSVANAVNDRGQAVGQSLNTLVPDTGRAFLWDNGALLDLGAADPSHTRSEARAINKKGVIVGMSGVSTLSIAWVWSEGVNTNLNTLIDPNDPNGAYVTLTAANGINDKGEIAAQGIDSRLGTANVRSYLLSPVK